MSEHYILDNRKAVPVDLMTWATWFETADRHVAKTQIGEVEVSTVFLGLDHNYGGGRLHLFETMVFGGPLDQSQERCATWEEAEAQHEAACNLVRGAAS